MTNYEVTFIVDPVLSNDEIKSAAKTYGDLLENHGANIVYTDEMGLQQLAYPINKRSSGIYYCIEFKSDAHDVIPKLELALKRDERIMRFLSIKLDKYGVKYNQDKRDGKIGKAKSPSKKGKGKEQEKDKPKAQEIKKPAPAPVPPASSEEE